MQPECIPAHSCTFLQFLGYSWATTLPLRCNPGIFHHNLVVPRPLFRHWSSFSNPLFFACYFAVFSLIWRCLNNPKSPGNLSFPCFFMVLPSIAMTLLKTTITTPTGATFPYLGQYVGCPAMIEGTPCLIYFPVKSRNNRTHRGVFFLCWPRCWVSLCLSMIK